MTIDQLVNQRVVVGVAMSLHGCLDRHGFGVSLESAVEQ
jgi:hypothetical protein